MYKKFLFAVIALSLLIIVLESLLRLVFFVLQDYKFRPIPFIINDQTYGYKPVPNTMSLKLGKQPVYAWNSFGFRNNEFESAAFDTNRIFCIGGSTTFGSGNEQDTTYPSLLQELLPQKYEVINAGVSGWSIYQHLLRLQEEVIHYHPNMIILHSVFNSFIYPKHYFKHDRWPTYFLFNHSIIFRVLDKLLASAIKWSFHQPIFDETTAKDLITLQKRRMQEGGVEKYRNALQMFSEFCEDHAIMLFVIIPPYRSDSKYYGNPDQFDELYHEIRTACAEVILDLKKTEKFYVVDMRTLFLDSKQMDSLFYDAIHPLGEGNKVIARELYEHMMMELINEDSKRL